MGAKTYEHALELSKDHGWAYGNIPTMVVTNRDLLIARQNIGTYARDLTGLVNAKLKPRYKNVWLVGGAMLAKEFIRLGLADEIRQSILPIILGEGLPFYDAPEIEQALHFKDLKAYKNGMVELIYAIKK